MTTSPVHPYFRAEYLGALQPGAALIAVEPWGGFLLRRPVDGGGHDAAGPYPLTPLTRSASIEAGLSVCRVAGLISVVVTPDPLLAAADQLQRAFPVCRPFKPHYVIDPSIGAFDPSKHHRERVRRGRRRCRVELVALIDHLPAWTALYDGLIGKHGIRGQAAFSGAYFDMLAKMPELRAFAAFVGEELAAMTLWFAYEGVVYNHLTASGATGYANGASFALYDAAISHFAGGVINLGGSAGLSDANDGLAQFKAGFANGEVQAHICGAVLDPQRYAALGGPATGYFPAYRAPR